MSHPELISPIRLVGDPILHAKGIPFPQKPTAEELAELQKQIEIAQETLIASGGAGIAANQCASLAKPYQFTIVGIYHANEVHLRKVGRRYPGVSFPEAVVMINPRIISKSQEEVTFCHGCLSVPGRLRGEMKTPRELEVEYLEINAEGGLSVARQVVQEMEAVVLQHELNHILLGKTYVDCCLAELDEKDRQAFRELLWVELEKRKPQERRSFEAGSLDFYRFAYVEPEKASTHLDREVFQKALEEELSMDALCGLKQGVELFFKK